MPKEVKGCLLHTKSMCMCEDMWTRLWAQEKGVLMLMSTGEGHVHALACGERWGCARGHREERCTCSWAQRKGEKGCAHSRGHRRGVHMLICTGEGYTRSCTQGEGYVRLCAHGKDVHMLLGTGQRCTRSCTHGNGWIEDKRLNQIALQFHIFWTYVIKILRWAFRHYTSYQRYICWRNLLCVLFLKFQTSKTVTRIAYWTAFPHICHAASKNKAFFYITTTMIKSRKFNIDITLFSSVQSVIKLLRLYKYRRFSHFPPTTNPCT